MKAIFLFLGLLFWVDLLAQQVPDTAFVFPIQSPKYASGKGSVVWLDAAHNNFHTLDGRYAPFGKVLQKDGYQLKSNTDQFTRSKLKSCRILVISNPLHASNVERWDLPNPSAFSPKEIEAVNHWVRSGGSLLLIADHMPFAGAAQALGQSFGIEFLNCFALDNRKRGLEVFYKGDQSMAQNELTQGIDTVVTFTGSAFRIPAGAEPILLLKDYTLKSPKVAWQFEENTPFVGSEGYCQGAYLSYGKGRVVVMGEAAMFSAQLSGPNRRPVGMNVPSARQNGQLLLNIIHWLDQ